VGDNEETAVVIERPQTPDDRVHAAQAAAREAFRSSGLTAAEFVAQANEANGYAGDPLVRSGKSFAREAFEESIGATQEQQKHRERQEAERLRLEDVRQGVAGKLERIDELIERTNR
jgi:hypothetical protein